MIEIKALNELPIKFWMNLDAGGLTGFSLTNKLQKEEMVMEKEIEILMQYAQADPFMRMHMFLQFPDLRDSFQEIDRKDLAAQKGSLAKEYHKRKCSWLLSFLNRMSEIKTLRHSEWMGRGEICPKFGPRGS